MDDSHDEPIDAPESHDGTGPGSLPSAAGHPAPASREHVSLADVAASVSLSTSQVLRSLRSDPETDEKMRRTVRAAAERLGFPIEDVAPRRGDGVIAVLTDTLRNPWISELVRAMRVELTATGRSLVVIPTRRRVPEVPRRADIFSIEAVKALGIEGFVLVSDIVGADEILETLSDRPVVGLSVPAALVGQTRPIDTVRIDEQLGMGLLVSHLSKLGHTDIAFAGGVGEGINRERADAFAAAMKEHGLADHARVEPCDFSEQVGYTAGSMLLRGADLPTAVLGANDVVALGLLAAARDNQMAVPSDLAVAGYGNTSLASSSLSNLTSIDPNSSRLGSIAAQFIVDRIVGADGDVRDVQVSPELMVRQSTSAGPNRDRPARRRRISVD